MMGRNRRTAGLSSLYSGERQGPLRGRQSPRVPKEGLQVALHLEKNQTEMAFSGPVPGEIGRFGVFGGLFHDTPEVVASRRPHRTTTAGPLRVVPRVKPGCFSS